MIPAFLGGLVMRCLLLSACGIIALSGACQAAAADLPVKAVALVPEAPIFNWSGLYFGASVGAQWFDSNSSYVYPGGTDAPSSGSTTLSNTNAIIAFQFGRNWQVPGSPFVFGLEGDWTETNHDRSATLFTYPNGNHFDAESQLGIQGSVRGRLGVASDNWLFYATGGLALAQGEALSTFTSNGSGSAVSVADKTLTGWTVGGGVE